MDEDITKCLEFDVNGSTSMENMVRVSTHYMDECLNRFRENIMQDHKKKQKINYDLLYGVIGSFSHQQKEYIMRFLEHCKNNPSKINSASIQKSFEKPIVKPLIKEYQEAEPEYKTNSNNQNELKKKSTCVISGTESKYIRKTLSLSLQNSSSQMLRQLDLLFSQMFDPYKKFIPRNYPIVSLVSFMEIIGNSIDLISRSIYSFGNTTMTQLYSNGTGQNLYKPELKVDQKGYRRDALICLKDVLVQRCGIQQSSDQMIKTVRDSFEKWQASTNFEALRNIVCFVLSSIYVLKLSIPLFEKENNIMPYKTGTNRNVDTYLKKYTEQYSIDYSFYNVLKYTHNYLMFCLLICRGMEPRETNSIISNFVSQEERIENEKMYKNSLFHILEIENSLDVSLISLLY